MVRLLLARRFGIHPSLVDGSGLSRRDATSPIQVVTLLSKMIGNAASGIISIQFGLCGHNTTVTTACSSAAHAVGDALRAIQYDDADVMLTGGSEAAMTPMGLGGFISARSLSMRNDDPPAASRPFDRDRDGFVLSEGAGLVVLEELEHARRRGATIYAEVLGLGSSFDAYMVTKPDPQARGAARAIEWALREARVDATTWTTSTPTAPAPGLMT